MEETLDLDQLVRETLEGFQPDSFHEDPNTHFYSYDHSQKFKDGYQSYVEFPSASVDPSHNGPAWFSPASVTSEDTNSSSGFVSTELDSSEKELMDAVLDLQEDDQLMREVTEGSVIYSDGESLSPPVDSPPKPDVVEFESIMDIYGLPTEGGLNLLNRNTYNQGFFDGSRGIVDIGESIQQSKAVFGNVRKSGTVINGINMDETLQDGLVAGLLEIGKIRLHV